jgi:hypothetical protein
VRWLEVALRIGAIIQEVHITMGHIICDLVEQELLLA